MDPGSGQGRLQARTQRPSFPWGSTTDQILGSPLNCHVQCLLLFECNQRCCFVYYIPETYLCDANTLRGWTQVHPSTPNCFAHFADVVVTFCFDGHGVKLPFHLPIGESRRRGRPPTPTPEK